MAAEFHIIKNGPVKVSGNFTLTGSDGKQIVVDDEVFLCRCGGSKNKPFCDNTHQTSGFCS
jgi:CDGSH-type Zn-finger protein